MKNSFLLIHPFLSCCFFFVCFIPLHDDAVFRLHGNGVVVLGTVTRWTRPCWASISFQREMVWDGACNDVYRISDLGTEFINASLIIPRRSSVLVGVGPRATRYKSRHVPGGRVQKLFVPMQPQGNI